MKKSLMIGIIVVVVLVFVAIIAGFFIFSNKDKIEKEGVCAASAWSPCNNGLQTRTNYRWDVKTAKCFPLEENQTCISCPSALQWSSCDINNKKTRINYRYNEATKSCENFSEQADCPKMESRSMLWNWTLTIYPNEGDKVKGVITAKVSPRIENIVNAEKVQFQMFKKGVDNPVLVDYVELSSSNEAHYTLNTTKYQNGIYIFNGIILDKNNNALDVTNDIITIEN